MSKKKKQENIEKPYRKKLIKKRKPNRSIWGDIFLYLFLAFVALVMAFPIIYAVSSALKPLDELFKFPPTILAKNPTMDNFSDLFVTMGKSWVSFSRYLFNTVFITFVGTFGHLIVASMGAFVLAKYDFPGGKGFFKLVTVAMMFTGYVTQIPNYLILNRLGWIDTYWSIIIPAFAAPIGLFLMKQFMEGLPTSLIEAAKIDGANEWKVFISIVMPKTLKKVGKSAFQGTRITQIYFYDGLESIGDNAFMYCSSLSKIRIPDSVEKVGQFLFLGAGKPYEESQDSAMKILAEK